MDNEKNPNTPQEDGLFSDLLAVPEVGEEIGPDEQAVSAAGLTHPADAELERIITETKTMEAQEDFDFPDPMPDTPAPEQEVQSSAIDEAFFHEDPLPEEDPAAELPPDEPFSDRPTEIFTADMAHAYFEETQRIPQSDEASELQHDEEEYEEEPDMPKGRPRMKKGYGLLGIPHLLATVIWLAIAVAIGVSLGRVMWLCAAEVLAFGNPDQEYTITITDDDNIDTIAVKLKNAGLISYPELFKLYADLTDAEEDISAGTFTLNSKFDYMALVNAMTYHSAAREVVEVMIPEGYTCAQIFALLEEKGVCTAAKLEEYAANGELNERWFLEGVERGDKYCLEGYLFPDTYEFYTNDEPSRVLGKFLDNFDSRFTDIMKEKLDPLNERMAAVLSSRGYTQEYIDSHKFTIREIVIIASMIEKETANDSESYDVSSVIYNRLTNPAEYLYLNIDATIIYALGGNIDPETGKTKPLTSEDLKLDSPYNTYTQVGLIPGPISNPGRNSLNAALDPTVTDYYYYVYNPNTSLHLFAKNASEHEKNVNYVRSLEED